MRSGKDSVRDSPLYRSLQELAGRTAKDVHRGLAELAPIALGERATAAVRGRSSGYSVIWALTSQRFVIVSSTPNHVPSVYAPILHLTGVHRTPGAERGQIHVMLDGQHHQLAAPVGECERFARTLAGTIRQEQAPELAVLTADGVARFLGEPVSLPVTYIGGFARPLPQTQLHLIADDGGIHLCGFAVPREFLFLDWDQIGQLRVDGVDEVRRRISLTDVALFGLDTAVIAGRMTSTVGYLTAVTQEGELILRSQLDPPRLRARLSRFLVAHDRPAAGPAAVADALARVADLHRSGALTDAEFAHAKRRILGSGEPA